jgi:hypothetical protein
MIIRGPRNSADVMAEIHRDQQKKEESARLGKENRTAAAAANAALASQAAALARTLDDQEVKRLAGLSTNEKLLEGMRRSDAVGAVGARQHRESHWAAANAEDATTGMGNASKNIFLGLKQSTPARGGSKPAA